MNPIDRSLPGIPPTPPRSFNLRRMAAPGVEPQDNFQPGSSAAPESMPEAPPARPAKTSLARKFMRWGGIAGMTVSAGAGLVGGIAYQANSQALQQAGTIHMHPQMIKHSEPVSLSQRLQSRATNNPTRLSMPGALEVAVPSDTVATFFNNLQDTPAVKQFLHDRIETAKTQLVKQLSQAKIPDGQLLADVSMPLPTSDRAALHVGGVDLPSLGFRALNPETVPVAVEYSTQPIATGVQVEVNPIKVDPSLKGPGVLIGAVHVRLTAPEGKIPVSGDVHVHLDLDGKATKARLEALRGQPGQEELIKQLEARLPQGERLQKLGQEQGFGQFLQEASDHNLHFQGEVIAPKGPLAETTLYLWAGPDRTGDGKADIQITQSNRLEALDQLKLHLKQVESTGKAPTGMVAKAVHQQAEKVLLQGLEQQMPKLNDQLRTLVHARAEKELAQGTQTLQAVADHELENMYGRLSHLKMETGNPMAPQISLDLQSVQVTPSGLLIDLSPPGTHAAHAPLASNLALKPGQIAMGVDVTALNRQMADRSKGGSVDWQPLLNQAKEKAGLVDVSFGADSQGRTMYPTLAVQDGKLVVSAEVVAKLQGAKPVKGATGLLSTATGALDSGAKDAQKSLKKSAGGFGAVLGSIVRAPAFALDQVAKGGKAILDNTVGKVIDTGSDAATRSTVHTRVTLPLRTQTVDGKLTFAVDSQGVEFQKAQSSTPFDLLDLLPTRLLSNLIVNVGAQAVGPGQVGAKMAGQGVNLDLSTNVGLQFEEAKVGPQGLTLIGRITPQTANWASGHLPK